MNPPMPVLVIVLSGDKDAIERLAEPLSKTGCTSMVSVSEGPGINTSIAEAAVGTSAMPLTVIVLPSAGTVYVPKARSGISSDAVASAVGTGEAELTACALDARETVDDVTPSLFTVNVPMVGWLALAFVFGTANEEKTSLSTGESVTSGCGLSILAKVVELSVVAGIELSTKPGGGFSVDAGGDSLGVLSTADTDSPNVELSIAGRSLSMTGLAPEGIKGVVTKLVTTAGTSDCVPEDVSLGTLDICRGAAVLVSRSWFVVFTAASGFGSGRGVSADCGSEDKAGVVSGDVMVAVLLFVETLELVSTRTSWTALIGAIPTLLQL